jgi:hypothetical protein
MLAVPIFVRLFVFFQTGLFHPRIIHWHSQQHAPPMAQPIGEQWYFLYQSLVVKTLICQSKSQHQKNKNTQSKIYNLKFVLQQTQHILLRICLFHFLIFAPSYNPWKTNGNTTFMPGTYLYAFKS